MIDDRDNVTVTYTVKELLGRLDHKIDVLTEKIDSRFDDHETRIRKLEDEAVTDDAFAQAKREFRGFFYRAIAAGTAILSVVVALANYFL